jgi:hypothetical protein
MLLRRLRCPICNALVGVPAKSPVGARARCGGCGQGFRVPSQHIQRGLRAVAVTEIDEDEPHLRELREAGEMAPDLHQAAFRSTLPFARRLRRAPHPRGGSVE